MSVALILGADDGIGFALAQKFAQKGLIACMVRRDKEKLAPLVAAIESQGGQAVALGYDLSQEEEVSGLVNFVEMMVGPIEVMIFNLGSFQCGSVLEETLTSFSQAWQQCCLAGFLCVREVAVPMLERGYGSMIFTGATASLRGNANFSAFAVAKGGLRLFAQSLAKELGPQNIHVAHVLIDGLAQSSSTAQRFPELFAARSQEEALLKPEHIAENYWYLHKQPRDAWTFELDLRPYAEEW
ncbi:MAG: hypothetical protein RL217_2103 [Pseudomonadota bacterium]|jgi:NAD(P)-dependent dehydrogenase (short-subunit alcohol dehydrogenase family)